MRLRQDHKIVIALLQVALVAIIFFLVNGLIAVGIYLVSEISLAEIGDFFLGLWSGEGVAVLGYHLFRKAKHRLWALLNEQRDSDVVSTRKIEELKKLLRK